MPDLRKLGIGSIEALLILVIAVMVIGLSVTTSTFLTLPNLFDLLNQSSVNIIFAVGLLVVLIAGGIDISFAVGASLVQYLTALTVMRLGAVPIRMGPAEIYESLARGTLDGALLAYQSVMAYHLAPLMKSGTLSQDFGTVTVTFSIRLKSWNALPADVR